MLIFDVFEGDFVAVFFEEDLDAGGDWDGDESANEAEHIDANSDGAKDGEDWELEAFTLDFW